MAPVDDSSTKQSANGSLAITFLLSCLRLQSEDSTVKQSQHSTVCARPGGHNGHHVALDNLWPSHGRHRGQRGPLPGPNHRGHRGHRGRLRWRRTRIQEPGTKAKPCPRNRRLISNCVLKAHQNSFLRRPHCVAELCCTYSTTSIPACRLPELPGYPDIPSTPLCLLG